MKWDEFPPIPTTGRARGAKWGHRWGRAERRRHRVFRGSYEHTIDLKGRLSIPSRFREELSKREVNTLVLTAGDRCIWAFPMDEWERLEERLRQPPHFSPEMRHVLRMLVGSAK